MKRTCLSQWTNAIKTTWKPTLSVIGRKSRWLFAFRTTSLLVGGGIRPALSGFIFTISTQILSWKGDCVHSTVVCCNRDFPVISAWLISDKLTCWHVQTSSNLVAFHNIQIILSRSFFSRFKTTRYVFPMSVRMIKRLKIFLSPPPQNAYESTRTQFSLLSRYAMRTCTKKIE